MLRVGPDVLCKMAMPPVGKRMIRLSGRCVLVGVLTGGEADPTRSGHDELEVSLFVVLALVDPA